MSFPNKENSRASESANLSHFIPPKYHMPERFWNPRTGNRELNAKDVLESKAENAAQGGNNFLRGAGETAKKPLPRCQPLGRFRLNFVKAYDQRSILKASARNEGDDPELFIDLEYPRPEFSEMKEPELHLGISANFRLEPQRNSKVKPHIDIYLPISETPRLLKALGRAQREGECGEG